MHDRAMQQQRPASAPADFGTHQGLPSVRTSFGQRRAGQQQQQQQPVMPPSAMYMHARSRGSTPLATPLMQHGQDFGDCDYYGDLGMLGFVKQEQPLSALHVGPNAPFGLGVALPSTSTHAQQMMLIGGQQQHFGQHKQHAAASNAMRAAVIHQPHAAQRFLLAAATLLQRAQVLETAEGVELDRARRLRVLEPPCQPEPPPPQPQQQYQQQPLLQQQPYHHHHQQYHHGMPSPAHGLHGLHTSLLDASPDGKLALGSLHGGGMGGMGHHHSSVGALGSPESLAMLSSLHQQFMASPTACYAEVRLLDSRNNTPTKSLALAMGDL